MKRLIDVLYYILGILFNICFTVVLIALIAVVSFTAFADGTQLFVEDLSGREDRVVILEVPDGRDTMAVAQLLQDNGLIDEGWVSRWVFVLQSRLGGSYRFFRSATFTLNTNMGSAALMDALVSMPQPPPSDEIRVTIFEGMTVRQLAEHLEHLELFTEQEFLDALQGDFLHVFLRDIPHRPNSLQGYLFPDTYNLPEDPRPEDLIVRMLDRFEQVFVNTFTLAFDSPHTLDDIVIIASIIEKEVRHAEEHATAAAVIHNRLRLGMPLEMYSTVQYVLDRPRNMLTPADFQVQSPYNTFNRQGLPRGPIASPGLSALNAAMHPAAVGYLHMTLRDDGSGLHDFR